MPVMFKLLGGIMVLLSSSFLGYILSADCRKRPRQLRELQSMLQLFENQISYLSDVLTAAFGRICGSDAGEVSIFFRETVERLQNGRSVSASQAWEEAVRGNIGNTSLNKEDEEILISFGKLLGSSDLEGQIKNIKLTLTQLKLQEQKAEESRKKNEGMYRSLGILGGIAVVIVLI